MSGRDPTEIQIDSLLVDVKIMTRDRTGAINLIHADGSTTRIGLARARDGQSVDLRVKLGAAPSLALMNGTREEMQTWLEHTATMASTRLRSGESAPTLRLAAPDSKTSKAAAMDADFIGVAPPPGLMGRFFGGHGGGKVAIVAGVAAVLAVALVHFSPSLPHISFGGPKQAMAAAAPARSTPSQTPQSRPSPQLASASSHPGPAQDDMANGSVVTLTAAQIASAPKGEWGTPSVPKTAFWMKPGGHAYLPMPGGGTITSPAGLASFGLRS